MKITTTGRKINITEGLKGYVDKKISKLQKYFQETTDARVTLSVQKDYHTVEVTIFHEGMIFRSEITDRDMYAAIDRSVDVLERQIRKQKTKLEKKLREGAFNEPSFFDYGNDEDEFKIVKVKKYKDKPMSPEEAILQMNLLGHEFYIFTNDVTNDKEVVYKRKDGNYGLIELNWFINPAAVAAGLFFIICFLTLLLSLHIRVCPKVQTYSFYMLQLPVG